MTPTEIRPLPNAADKAALKAIATRLIQTCPSLQDTAHEVASDLLKKYGITDLDPDRVYFHRFDASQSSSKAFTGWEHAKATPTSSMTLTQLVIHRFRVADQDNADLLDVYAGFYTAGPNAGTFDETNEVRLHGNEVLKDFWSIDFSSLYTDRLTAFWNDSGTDFRTLAKCSFLGKAVEARDKRQLSDEDFQFITTAVIGPITWPVNLQLLQARHPCSDSVRTLDVDQYTSTHILRFIVPKGRQIVYLPGEADAFQVLETATDMHYWMLLRMNKEDARQTFMAHFSLADRQDIAENITAIMNRLVSTWGKYDHHLINPKNQAITGDAFNWLRDSTKDAMFTEARLSLTSDGDLRKKLWIGYLSAGVKVFGPMAVVGWPVALPVIGASIANLGLNIDQAVNGNTAEERKAGILGAVLSGIDVLFNLLVIKGPGALEDIGAEVNAAEAKEMAELMEANAPNPAAAVTGEASLIEELTPTLPETRQSPMVPDHWQANELLEGETPGAGPGKFQGIFQLNANPSTAIMMDDLAYYVRYESDLNGTGHWAIIDPENPHSFRDSIPVRLNEEGKWQIVSRNGLKGGGKTPATAGTSTAREPNRAPTVPLPASEYDVPPQLKPHLEDGAAGSDDDALRDAYDSLDDVDAHRDFKAIRKRLYRDAIRFYADLNLPERPPIPQLNPNATAEEIIEKIFDHARGLVIGESHDGIGSKQWLIDNMALLARRNVKTLYMEHLLTDFHQAALDSFGQTGVMSKELERYLKVLDTGNMTDPLERDTFLGLVKEAGKQGIHVQAIDCMASYRLNGMDIVPDQERFIDETARQKMMNYFARSIIRTDQAVRGAHKWVALMGNSHSNTFEGVAGVSELEEGIGIRVEDVAEGTSHGIEVDPGKILPMSNDIFDRTALVRGDLRLQVETPWIAQSMTEIEALLPHQGMYTLKLQPGMTFLVHRSRNNSIVRTLIQNDGGRYYIERPNWPSVSGKRYGGIKALLQGLDAMGLKLAGWSKPL
ncbi:hypothetical protein FHW68_004711 [Pseudomonas sp. Tn43]|uniref:membrane-targeted effector domain-containing toxin n=1 Tax=Pseudomonas sp. Tn43 TaxID=701213 RepID=UPI0016218183|nr:membrane-targeted effector domain-containing toxin [Pseudomonas sp. Tn43]MBB3243144.1 hypothetical protein [Pseudomonas sp. Tn43]